MEASGLTNVGSSPKRNNRGTVRAESPPPGSGTSVLGREDGPMAFGQQSGPPATARQVAQLMELITAAGHSDFRDARGPLGLTQRQAAGKFTRGEADDLIARLEAEAAESGDGAPDDAAVPAASAARFDRREAQWRRLLADMPAEALAAELQRRGWAVMEP